MTPFRQKTENFNLFGLSDNEQILLAYGINAYHEITNGISDFRRQHLQRVIRNSLLEHQLSRRTFAFKRFHVLIAVANSISSKYYL